ncbi:MAG: 6-phosphogluconolactonase [Candidatus Gracilibacteria bacterium]|nr:6-phosphogluconolactonase [Candidatus Gracilibacteria bacterium]
MNKIITLQSENKFVKTVVDHILDSIKKKKGLFRMAVSGGSTPGPIYKRLAASDQVDWTQVEIYLVDERYVSAENEHSNYRLITNELIAKFPSPPAKWVNFNCSLTIYEALDMYERSLDSLDKQFFDLILLGLGADGHTASLFPADPLLTEETRWVGHSSKGHPVPDRLTLTYPALESSREILFLVKGKTKENILQRIQEPDSQLPAKRIFQLEKTKVFFGDYA